MEILASQAGQGAIVRVAQDNPRRFKVLGFGKWWVYLMDIGNESRCRVSVESTLYL